MLNWLLTEILISPTVLMSSNKGKVILPAGHTIDYAFPEEERCPHCSGQVYHIHEDNHIVYCIQCGWRDRTILPKGQNYRERERQQQVEFFRNAFDRGGCLYLKVNRKYPACVHPLISYEDVSNYTFAVRDFDDSLGYELLSPLYNGTTKLVMKYSSIEDMVCDGWRLD